MWRRIRRARSSAMRHRASSASAASLRHCSATSTVPSSRISRPHARCRVRVTQSPRWHKMRPAIWCAANSTKLVATRAAYREVRVVRQGIHLFRSVRVPLEAVDKRSGSRGLAAKAPLPLRQQPLRPCENTPLAVEGPEPLVAPLVQPAGRRLPAAIGGLAPLPRFRNFH